MSSSQPQDLEFQKGVVSDVKPAAENAPRRADGISQLCMYCLQKKASLVSS